MQSRCRQCWCTYSSWLARVLAKRKSLSRQWCCAQRERTVPGYIATKVGVVLASSEQLHDGELGAGSPATAKGCRFRSCWHGGTAPVTAAVDWAIGHRRTLPCQPASGARGSLLWLRSRCGDEHSGKGSWLEPWRDGSCSMSLLPAVSQLFSAAQNYFHDLLGVCENKNGSKTEREGKTGSLLTIKGKKE